MTSQALMPSRSHISASSLASAMLTARKVFSCSLAVSATVVLEHRHDVVDDRLVEQLRCARRHSVGDAGDELRRVAQVPRLVAGVDALGRVAEEEVLADDAAAPPRGSARTTSSVVPG